MSNFILFITRRVFYKHLAIYAFLLMLIVASASIILNQYTEHGLKITMPDLRGKTLSEIETIANENGFELKVIDSIYKINIKKGSILEQTPKPGVSIKKNRVVYLTLVSFNPEMIKMPELVNTSIRQATATIESYGLVLGTLHYKPDFAENYVLEQKFKGQKIKTGTKIQKGSTIDLVVGMGKGDGTTTDVPNLIGLTYKEAVDLITVSMLNVGAVVYGGDVKTYSDSSDVVVWKQDPPANNEQKLIPGSIVDIWLKNKNLETVSNKEIDE